MTPTQYQEACMRTASPISRATMDNLRMQGAMGLCGETAELYEAAAKSDSRSQIIGELGDVLWYAATLARSIGMDFGDIMAKVGPTAWTAGSFSGSAEHWAIYMMRQAGSIMDRVKKETFQGHPADTDGIYADLVLLLTYALCVAGSGYRTLEEVAEANIVKLRSRYPKGFEAARSTHREAEA